MFKTTKTIKTGESFQGYGPDGMPIFWSNYTTLTEWNKKLIGMVASAIAIIIVGIVSVGAILINKGDNSETTTVNTVAQTVVVQDNVYGPEWVKPNLYVCDTNTTSTEYTFVDDTNVWSDGLTHDIDWTQLLDVQVVMVWEIQDNDMLADFRYDISLFNEYTHAGVRVEEAGYVAQENDFIVPVVIDETESGWAHMESMYSMMPEFFGMPEYVTVDSARLVIDPAMLEESTWLTSSGAVTTGWSIDHTNTMLHEMGHLFGLGHTHDEVGEQVDSIMSYESDRSVRGFLPGDIAGLKEVFC
jgi:hypothetical protein